MKVLVIHPQDSTTDFLCPTYTKDFTVIRTEIGDSLLKSLIRQHDVIIMMGHGDTRGLYGFDRHIVDASFVDELRKKICICIWCYAADFVEHYDLKSPFSTGMFISESEEADALGEEYDEGDIEESNFWFTEALKGFFSDLEKYDYKKLNRCYNVGLNSITEYNRKQFIQTWHT
jgi:hypothetical protein